MALCHSAGGNNSVQSSVIAERVNKVIPVKSQDSKFLFNVYWIFHKSTISNSISIEDRRQLILLRAKEIIDTGAAGDKIDFQIVSQNENEFEIKDESMTTTTTNTIVSGIGGSTSHLDSTNLYQVVISPDAKPNPSMNFKSTAYSALQNTVTPEDIKRDNSGKLFEFDICYDEEMEYSEKTKKFKPSQPTTTETPTTNTSAHQGIRKNLIASFRHAKESLSSDSISKRKGGSPKSPKLNSTYNMDSPTIPKGRERADAINPANITNPIPSIINNNNANTPINPNSASNANNTTYPSTTSSPAPDSTGNMVNTTNLRNSSSAVDNSSSQSNPLPHSNQTKIDKQESAFEIKSEKSKKVRKLRITDYEMKGMKLASESEREAYQYYAPGEQNLKTSLSGDTSTDELEERSTPPCLEAYGNGNASTDYYHNLHSSQTEAYAETAQSAILLRESSESEAYAETVINRQTSDAYAETAQSDILTRQVANEAYAETTQSDILARQTSSEAYAETTQQSILDRFQESLSDAYEMDERPISKTLHGSIDSQEDDESFNSYAESTLPEGESKHHWERIPSGGTLIFSKTLPTRVTLASSHEKIKPRPLLRTDQVPNLHHLKQMELNEDVRYYSDSSSEEIEDEDLDNPLRKSSDSHNDLSQTDQWTERFQNILSIIRSLSPTSNFELQSKVNAEMAQLSQDFVHCARTYGKIIISEKFSSQKTIQPLNLGGIAGGEKYIVHNILFKFAVDNHGLLGSNYAAAKVAGNELKGLLCYFNCHLLDVRLPLMALVDYLGFRIVAISLLPINKSTLIYGTQNGGKTVLNSSQKFDRIMQSAAKMLNLKSHTCGLQRIRSKVLHSAADLEGHLGEDGKFYLLDFARALPPEKPDKKIKRSHLFRLLRPEFVKNYVKPLCSDAFSGFIQADKQVEVHNEEIREASEYLYNRVIPNFVRDSLTWQIMESKSKKQLDNFRVTEAIHTRGICMRHIGLLLPYVRESEEFNEVRVILIMEACARVIKNNLRGKLRRTMKKLKQPLEMPYRKVVIDYLNLIFGNTDVSKKYWNSVIKCQLREYFSVTSSITENLYPLKTIIYSWETECILPYTYLLKRVIELTGIRLSTIVTNKFTLARIEELQQAAQPFDETDLIKIGESVKHMNIAAEALGTFLHHKALKCKKKGEIGDAILLLQIAIVKFEEALTSNPTNRNLLRSIAICLTRVAEFKAEQKNQKQFSVNDQEILKTDKYYIMAIAEDANDPLTLYCYGKFLWRCGRLERAEEYFLQCLEADPVFIWALKDYSKLLLMLKKDQQLLPTAKQFWVAHTQCLRQRRSTICENPV